MNRITQRRFRCYQETRRDQACIILMTTVAVLLTIALPAFAEPLDYWHWRNSLQQVNGSLQGITYGNGTFVAVGTSGTIITSIDGETWTSKTSGTTNNLYGVAYGNGTFVAVGSGIILTSSDGTTWTNRTSSYINSSLFSITYGNGTFVAVGGNSWAGISTILTSPDGTTWSSITPGTINALYGVTYGNGTFVAVGDNGTIFSSPNGAIWTRRRGQDNTIPLAVIVTQMQHSATTYSWQWIDIMQFLHPTMVKSGPDTTVV